MENNKYWLHRISHEWDAAYKLLSEGWLTIGWSSLYDSGIDKVKDVKEFEKIRLNITTTYIVPVGAYGIF